jgi:hypothetical protein
MKYKFDLKMQLLYGAFTAISALAVLYLFNVSSAPITASIIGIINFAVAGFYDYKKC